MNLAFPAPQAHLVLTFGISPSVRIYCFPFCQQKKITLLPALSITEISTRNAIIKAQMRGLVLLVMPVLGRIRGDALSIRLRTAAGPSRAFSPSCHQQGRLLTCGPLFLGRTRLHWRRLVQ